MPTTGWGSPSVPHLLRVDRIRGEVECCERATQDCRWNRSDCTSFATVVLPTGENGSVTADHCYQNGQSLASGPNQPGQGSEYYGSVHGRDDYPTYDMERISPLDGEYFAPWIYTNPASPSIRQVTGAGDPGVGAMLCASDHETLNVCGLEVLVVDATYCINDGAPGDGCRKHTFKVRKAGEQIIQGGDSGEPLYARPTDSTALIRGMGFAKGSTGDGSDVIWAHHWSSIRDHLNVTIAT